MTVKPLEVVGRIIFRNGTPIGVLSPHMFGMFREEVTMYLNHLEDLDRENTLLQQDVNRLEKRVAELEEDRRGLLLKLRT